jgi:hypothetical protein
LKIFKAARSLSISAAPVRLYSERRGGMLEALIEGENTMRFIMIVKASKESEAGAMPRKDLIEAMGRFNEEMAKAGVLLAADGLHSSAKGARVRFSGGKTTVIDGPFAETKELIAGFWMIQVKSKEEAIAWARRSPAPHGDDQESEIEIRQVFEAADFPEEVLSPEAAARGRALHDELQNKAKK